MRASYAFVSSSEASSKKAARTVNDIFFFARAPVHEFMERYMAHRRVFAQHIEVTEITKNFWVDDLNSSSRTFGTSLEHNRRLSLVHARSTAALEAVPWDADGEDGAKFDFLQKHLNHLSATLTELDTMGQFVKLSVDNMDQLQFKVLLFSLNGTG